MTALLLAVPLALAAPVPKELKKEVPALNGAWRMTGLTFNGRQIGGNQNSVWAFDGESMTIDNGNGRVNPARPIKTDAAASPKQFEFGNAGTQLGIYEIKDDTLTIALGQQQGVRPTDFTAQNQIVYTFTRVKDKDK